MDKKQTQAEKKAKEYGIDPSLTEFNLSLSYEERLEQHQRALELALALRKAGRDLYGKPEQTPQGSR